MIALVLLGGAIILRDLHIVSFPLPQNGRQVPREIFLRGKTLAGLRFGIELGSGVRTYAPAGAPYILGVALLLGSVSPMHAAAAGVGFGLGRASMTAARRWSRRGDEWDRLLRHRLGWLVPASSSAVLAGMVIVASGMV